MHSRSTMSLQNWAGPSQNKDKIRDFSPIGLLYCAKFGLNQLNGVGTGDSKNFKIGHHCVVMSGYI